MAKVLLLLSVALLSGCATRLEMLENRVVCTLAADKAMVVSMWGVIGISSNISPKDAKTVCPSRD